MPLSVSPACFWAKESFGPMGTKSLLGPGSLLSPGLFSYVCPLTSVSLGRKDVSGPAGRKVRALAQGSQFIPLACGVGFA